MKKKRTKQTEKVIACLSQICMIQYLRFLLFGIKNQKDVYFYNSGQLAITVEE
jgi:hypothetical protein